MTSLTSVACSIPRHADPQRAVQDTESANSHATGGGPALTGVAEPRPVAGVSHDAGHRRRERARQPRAGGTPTPTPTRPSTATSSATSDFVWCPEGLREAEAHLLGRLSPGGGCSRSAAARRSARAGWPPRARCRSRSTSPAGMLRHARRRRRGDRRPGAAGAGRRAAAAVRDASLRRRPARRSARCRSSRTRPAVMREVARVLRPGGRWVFAATHPMRWAFPDDPGPAGLTVAHVVLRPPPVRRGGRRRRQPTYVEHHRTLGDRVRELVARRAPAGRPDRAGVAGGARPGSGASGARCAAGCSPAPRSSSRSSRSGPALSRRLVRGSRPDQDSGVPTPTQRRHRPGRTGPAMTGPE